jgi:antitoxin (DNA-binding transcriptional repressor) of toxin-antitoxin stability system
MKTVTMLEFRLHADRILSQVQQGERIVLTYRGKAVARLEPIVSKTLDADDPFYSLDSTTETTGESLSNTQIDEILYGQ